MICYNYFMEWTVRYYEAPDKFLYGVKIKAILSNLFETGGITLCLYL